MYLPEAISSWIDSVIDETQVFPIMSDFHSMLFRHEKIDITKRGEHGYGQYHIFRGYRVVS
jgi:hypothetical protein